MKFFIVLTMLAVSGLASAQMGSGSGSSSASSVTPSASGSTTSPDSSGSMNTSADKTKNKNIDSTRSEQQRMEDNADRGLDSAEGSMNDNTDMNTVPSQNPSSTTTP